jgi:hypothetical protein
MWRLRSTRLLILALAFYTVFAQPGLPACWMALNGCRDQLRQGVDNFSTLASLKNENSSLPTAIHTLRQPNGAEMIGLLAYAGISWRVESDLPKACSWPPTRIEIPPKSSLLNS